MRNGGYLPKDSEGLFSAILVKMPCNFNRLEGAERDGDRIYAVALNIKA
ncbi:MAG TPA: hypothetical protein VF389_04790 [Woeseiaceae bacterium]